MNLLLITQIVEKVADPNPSFGFLAGIALIMLVFFIGLGILYNGWPKFKK
jgi:hypothetical protein